MEEKPHLVSIENEVLDSFSHIVCPLYISFYCQQCKIKLVEYLEFEAFVYVICNWR